MKLLSVNVGVPREVISKGKSVSTAIFKEPVQGRVVLRTLNLEGDRQADLSVHGGPDKAVYLYPAEHYEYWRQQLPGRDLPWGSFGENFSIQGLLEDSTNIGDRFRIGSAEVIVTQPRLPCYKLGIKFGQPDMVTRFANSRRTGFYTAVLQEGNVGAGDDIELIDRDENHVTVADITRVYLLDKGDFETISRAVRAKSLPESWRSYFMQQIEQPKL